MKGRLCIPSRLDHPCQPTSGGTTATRPLSTKVCRESGFLRLSAAQERFLLSRIPQDTLKSTGAIRWRPESRFFLGIIFFVSLPEAIKERGGRARGSAGHTRAHTVVGTYMVHSLLFHK